VVKALYKVGEKWLWAQEKFCVKEEPEPPHKEFGMKIELFDRDNDGFTEVVLVKLFTPEGRPVAGAEVFIDGESVGVTNEKGLVDHLIERAGEHWIEAGNDEFWIEREFWVDEEPEPRELWFEVELFEHDDDGLLNDVYFGVFFNDEPIDDIPIWIDRNDEPVGHTGDEGALILLDVEPGEYKAWIEVRGIYEDAHFEIKDEPQEPGWTISVAIEGNNVMFTIVDLNGDPVVRAPIYLGDSPVGHTNQRGVLWLEDLEPGTYTAATVDPLGNEYRVTFIIEESEPPVMWIDIEQYPQGVHAIVGMGDHRLSGASVYLDDEYVGETNDYGSLYLGDPEAGEHWAVAEWESPDGEVFEAVTEFYVDGEPEPSPWVFTVNVHSNYVQLFVKDEEGRGINEAPIYIGDELLGYTNYYGVYYFHTQDWEPGTYVAVTIDPDDNEYAVTFTIEGEPEPTIVFTVEVFAHDQDELENDVRLRVTDEDGYGIDDVEVFMGDDIVGNTNVYGYLHLFDMEEGRYTAWVEVENIVEDAHWVIEVGGDL